MDLRQFDPRLRQFNPNDKVWAQYAVNTWYPAIILGRGDQHGGFKVEITDINESFDNEPEFSQYVRPHEVDFRGRGVDDYIVYFCYFQNFRRFSCKILPVRLIIAYRDVLDIPTFRNRIWISPEVREQMNILNDKEVEVEYLEDLAPMELGEVDREFNPER